jgi:hypothetical protein
VTSRNKQISFYSERLGKQISGTYSLSGRMLIVTSLDGRQKTAPLGGSKPEILARLALTELELKNSRARASDAEVLSLE